VFGGFRVLPYRRKAGNAKDDQSFVFRLMSEGVLAPLVCEAIIGKDDHVCTM
jgi:hypothetical protein